MSKICLECLAPASPDSSVADANILLREEPDEDEDEEEEDDEDEDNGDEDEDENEGYSE